MRGVLSCAEASCAVSSKSHVLDGSRDGGWVRLPFPWVGALGRSARAVEVSAAGSKEWRQRGRYRGGGVLL